MKPLSAWMAQQAICFNRCFHHS